MKMVKKILLWTVVAFVIYAVFSSPTQAANVVQNTWDIIVQGFRSIGSFFNSLLNRS